MKVLFPRTFIHFGEVCLTNGLLLSSKRCQCSLLRSNVFNVITIFFVGVSLFYIGDFSLAFFFFLSCWWKMTLYLLRVNYDTRKNERTICVGNKLRTLLKLFSSRVLPPFAKWPVKANFDCLQQPRKTSCLEYLLFLAESYEESTNLLEIINSLTQFQKIFPKQFFLIVLWKSFPLEKHPSSESLLDWDAFVGGVFLVRQTSLWIFLRKLWFWENEIIRTVTKLSFIQKSID